MYVYFIGSLSLGDFLMIFLFILPLQEPKAKPAIYVLYAKELVSIIVIKKRIHTVVILAH